MNTQQRKVSAGRPPKFTEPSCPVTITLPLRTIEALQRVDRDRAKAIVMCVDAVAGNDESAARRVQLIETFPGFGMIIIPPSPSLRKLEQLRLVEIAPERFLLVALGDYSAQTLELDIQDLLENLAPESEDEGPVLAELKQVLSCNRRQENITSGRLLLIGL